MLNVRKKTIEGGIGESIIFAGLGRFGFWLLAFGFWLLAFGFWLLVFG